MKYRCTLVGLTAFVPIAGIGRDLEDSLVESPFLEARQAMSRGRFVSIILSVRNNRRLLINWQTSFKRLNFFLSFLT